MQAEQDFRQAELAPGIAGGNRKHSAQLQAARPVLHLRLTAMVWQGRSASC